MLTTPLPWITQFDLGYSRWVAFPHSGVSIRRKKSSNSNVSRSTHPYAPHPVTPRFHDKALYVPEESDDMSESPMFLREEFLTSIESIEFHRPSESSQPSDVPLHENEYDQSMPSRLSVTPPMRRSGLEVNSDRRPHSPSLIDPSRIMQEALSVRIDSPPPTTLSRQIRFAPPNLSLETLHFLTFPTPNPNDSIHHYPEAPSKGTKGRRSASAGRQYLRHKSSNESSLRCIASLYSNLSRRLTNKSR